MRRAYFHSNGFQQIDYTLESCIPLDEIAPQSLNEQNCIGHPFGKTLRQKRSTTCFHNYSGGDLDEQFAKHSKDEPSNIQKEFQYTNDDQHNLPIKHHRLCDHAPFWHNLLQTSSQNLLLEEKVTGIEILDTPVLLHLLVNEENLNHFPTV